MENTMDDNLLGFTPDVQGALSALRQQAMINPQERQAAIGQRNQASLAHQAQLNTPIPEVGGLGSTVQEYLKRYAMPGGNISPARTMIGAIGQAGQNDQNLAIANLERKDQATAFGLSDAQKNLSEIGNYGKTLMGSFRGAGAAAGRPTVKMDKDGNMVVYDPTSGQSKVVHSSRRGEYQRVWGKAYDKAVSEGMSNPEDYAHQVSSNVLGTEAPASGHPQTEDPGSPASSSATLRYKDKAEEARKKEFSTGLESSGQKEYDEQVRPAAQAARSMLDTLSAVRQIPRTQDAFAPYREKLGSAMNALGLDGSMVREAENLQQVRPLLAKIANDRLLLAKGVQTEGDAQRAYNEFAKITDTQAAVDFMYEWAEELSNRAKFKDQVYKTAASENKSWNEGSNYWDRTDYSKTAPVAILKGKPWAFSRWRDQFLRTNKEASLADAIEVWNQKTGGK